MERLDGSLRAELARIAPGGTQPATLAEAWPRAVGETVARRAWPARLRRDGTLVVHAVSSTWAFELGRMADDVLERLRAELGPAAPAALQFVPGPVPEAPPAPAAAPAARPPQPSPEDAELAAAAAAAIAGPELRELVSRAAAASLARARSEARSDRGF